MYILCQSLCFYSGAESTGSGSTVHTLQASGQQDKEEPIKIAEPVKVSDTEEGFQNEAVSSEEEESGSYEGEPFSLFGITLLRQAVGSSVYIYVCV